MKFIGWIVDASGKVIGEISEVSRVPGCLWVFLGIGLCCVFSLFTVSGTLFNAMKIGAEIFLPENWTTDPLYQKIQSGNAPISMAVTGDKCVSPDGCGLDLRSGSLYPSNDQSYLTLVITNDAPPKSQGRFSLSKVYFPSHPDIELSCITNLYGSVLEPGQILLAHCLSNNRIVLPEGQFCAEVTYAAELDTRILGDKSPLTAKICENISSH